MNLNIKKLEEIGQNLSIKEFDTTEEMIKSAQISADFLEQLPKYNQEYVCAVFPEDDSEDDSDDEEQEET